MGYPFTLNGKIYYEADFAPYAYAATFPNVMQDLSDVAGQVAADRAAVKAALDTNGNLLIPATQARLDYANPNQLLLRAVGGNFLWINGLNRPIPGGGVVLQVTGLTPGAVYYVYAYMSGTTMTLEASTTGAALGTNGIWTKNGDATRTLVGMAGIDAGPTFADTQTKRYVVSRYNQSPRTLVGDYFVTNTTSTTAVELSTSYRVNFVSFADNIIDIQPMGITSNNTAGQANNTYTGVDGTSRDMFSGMTSGNSGQSQPAVARTVLKLSDGQHYATLMGFVSSGTGTWSAKLMGSIS